MSRRRNQPLLVLLLLCASLYVAGCDTGSNPTTNGNGGSSGSGGTLYGVLPTNTTSSGRSGGNDYGNGNGGNGGSGSLSLFVTPDDGDQPIVDQLRNARKSIRMVMYLLTERDIINELIAAQNRGLNVRVMLEQHPFGGSGNTNTVYNELRNAGVQVNWSNPVFALTHQKSFVIDDSTAIITTANATHSAFTKNREYGVVDTIPDDVLEVATIFDADWNRTQPDLSHANLVWSPVNSRTTFDHLIDSTKQTLYVECEETQDNDVINRLVNAARNGVKVELITNKPASSTDGNSRGIDTLKRGGVQVRYISGLYMHAKLFVVDGKLGWIGSENISSASLDQNREVGILLNDANIVGRLSDTFNADWNNSR
jgi:cardiolipin synthase A/B